MRAPLFRRGRRSHYTSPLLERELKMEFTASGPISREPLPASSLILLTGDNVRTTALLHQSLVSEGFHVQLAANYQEVEALWLKQRYRMVLLEVSGPQGAEAAVKVALSLKRHNPQQFIGYLADPILHTSGLAGDAIFPRTPDQLVRALKLYFDERSSEISD